MKILCTMPCPRDLIGPYLLLSGPKKGGIFEVGSNKELQIKVDQLIRKVGSINSQPNFNKSGE